MIEKKEILDKTINFRATEEMYKSLMKYLEETSKTITGFMRQITFDYLTFKKDMKKNGYKE